MLTLGVAAGPAPLPGHPLPRALITDPYNLEMDRVMEF